jgi:hypothetical protein
MQFMRLAEVPIGLHDRVFRYSPIRALFVAFSIICASGGLGLFGWIQQAGLAYYIAGVLLLGLVVMSKFVLARFQPSNWLVRLSDQGMFLQFRSYLNHHFPAHDLTVVFIPYAEIRSVRLVQERSNIPYRDLDRPLAERSYIQRRRLVELELTGDLAPLAQALAGESTIRPSSVTLYKHYPVRMMSPPFVQVEWGVVPSPNVLVDALRRYTNIASPIEVSHDYENLEGLSREEQGARLLSLVEAGKTLDAVYVARKLYSYDLTQARAFIEGLHSSR